MRIALWVVQIVLALAFGMGGFMKLTFPLEELATGMDWVSRVPSWAPRVAGASGNSSGHWGWSFPQQYESGLYLRLSLRPGLWW